MKILFISISSVILCSIGEFVDDVNFVVSDDDQSEEEFLDEDPNNVHICIYHTTNPHLSDQL